MSIFNSILSAIIRFFGSVKLALGSVLTGGLALSISLLLLFSWLAEEVWEGDSFKFDQVVRDYVHGFANPVLTDVMRALSFLGSTVFLVSFGAILVIIFLITKHKRRAIVFMITTIGASILIWILKQTFRRPRPEPFFNIPLPNSDSFPSGHSLGSFCFYGALAAIIINRTEKLWLKVLTLTCAAALILLIGLSRIYLGVHYPSDVFAGFSIGIIWVTTVAITDKLLHAREEKLIENESNGNLN